MKVKYFSYKYLIPIIILFTCLFLFSTPSFVLIPGDFGSAEGPTPDGCVDFEDLMIFALAYGSTSADNNWNEVCDIAGPGSLIPDGVIDFEDLMIFAMNYGQRDKVNDVWAVTITYQSSMSKLQDKINQLEEEGKLPSSCKLNEPTGSKQGVINYELYVGWHGYYEATGYRVYRSANGSTYTLLDDWQPSYSSDRYGIWDYDVSEGNNYSYYVTAYGTDWETAPSQIVTRDTWLPPCSLISPADQSIITDPNPTFTWDPVDVASFPYGSICSGNSDLWIWDSNESAQVWYIIFNNLTTSTAIYNQDGQATPLVPGHGYEWSSTSCGYDEEGNFIAWSSSGDWYFQYGEIVSRVGAYAITRQGTSMDMFQKNIDRLVEEGKIPDSLHLNELPPLTKGVVEYIIDVNWHSYPEATGYRVYRSVNGGDYSIVLDEEISGYTWYGRWDNDVSPGNTYSYYVTAYGTDWETAPSEIVTRDTWLPLCSLISPTDESIITDPNPTFTWNPVGLSVSDFPYGSIISGDSRLWVYDDTADEEVWYILFEDDMIISTITYNNDGQATPLTAGHSYYWTFDAYGYDEDGTRIAASYSGCWDFVYSGGMPAGITKVYARAETYNSSRILKIMLNELEENKASSAYYFNELEESKDTGINYSISLDWSAYCETTGCGYRVYRKINEGEYEIVFSQDAPTGYDWYYWYDNEAGPGSTYSYYVTAYGTDWETAPSEIVTIDTWLPLCSLISPTDESIITDSNPTFTWNPVGLNTSDLPYGSIISGSSRLWVYDDTTEEEAWYIRFEDDLTTSTITYNDDGQATPLTASHSYYWNSRAYGYDENGNCIAASGNGDWKFVYSGGMPAGITKVIATARTRHLSTMSKCYLNELEESKPGKGYFFNEPELLEKAELNHSILLSWSAYCETTGCGYRVYRKIDEGEYGIVFSQDAPTGYDWYEWEDNEAGPGGNTYSYYVTAYGPDWEADPSEIVTIDTWLPHCTLNSPPDGAVTDINPTFSWSSGAPDFPYGPLYFGSTCMLVYDLTTYEFVWLICFDDPDTSTATYNQDGQATPLISGHSYTWHSWASGHDENGNRIAVSESEHWGFDYIGD